MIVAVCKPALAAHLKIDLAILLPFFGDDVDKSAGTAAAVQRGCPGDHFDMLDVERVDGVELAAVGAGRVEPDAVNQHDDGAPAHVHPIVGAPLAADVDARDQLRQHVFELFSALDLLLNFLALNDPGGLGHFGYGAMGAVRANDDAVFFRLSRQRRQSAGQQQRVEHPEALFHIHSFYEQVVLSLLWAGVGPVFVTMRNIWKNSKKDFAHNEYRNQYHLRLSCARKGNKNQSILWG